MHWALKYDVLEEPSGLPFKTLELIRKHLYTGSRYK